MKTCPVCALELEDAYLFCPEDGSALKPVDVDAPGNGSTDFNRTQSGELTSERSGYRLAAISTVIALALLGAFGLYAVVIRASRRPRIAQVATPAEAISQPFVQTPTEAQDFKETPLAPSSSVPEQQVERPPDRARTGISSPPAFNRVTRKPEVEHKPPAPAVAQPLTRMNKVSTAPMPEIPRGNAGGFDARVIRVRARQSASGFRYDLTFNMQEQAGRAAQWQRLLITTRSASGVSHSEAIPFSHRLGAAGALIFTISVEMAGRTEADWQGRVLCTTLGWDNNGAPLQARFGANLAP